MGDDYVVMDLENPYVLDSSRFLSMGKCTPFEGWTVYGKTQMTFWNGKIVYEV